MSTRLHQMGPSSGVCCAMASVEPLETHDSMCGPAFPSLLVQSTLTQRPGISGRNHVSGRAIRARAFSTPLCTLHCRCPPTAGRHSLLSRPCLHRCCGVPDVVPFTHIRTECASRGAPHPTLRVWRSPFGPRPRRAKMCVVPFVWAPSGVKEHALVSLSRPLARSHLVGRV